MHVISCHFNVAGSRYSQCSTSVIPQNPPKKNGKIHLKLAQEGSITLISGDARCINRVSFGGGAVVLWFCIYLIWKEEASKFHIHT